MVLAVDFGGTKTAIALVDENGSIHERRVLASARTVTASVEQIASVSDGWDAAGIVVPGIYDDATGLAWCPNLWGPSKVPLREAVRNRLGTNVFIDSDRAGCVLGESWLGAARGLRHVVFVASGTGIGVGILADGAVVRGAGGVAGAAGWFALTPEWKDAYRSVGCWEAEAAGPSVARRAGLADGAAVVTAARAGNRAAVEALDRAARFTAMGIANLISAFNPEAVVLGGGFIAGAGDLILNRIRAEVVRWAQPVAASCCRIDVTTLGEDAALLGAARLALDGI